MAVAIGASACREEPGPRTERCIWQIGTITSDAAEPGFSGTPLLQGIRFGITQADRDKKLGCRLELVEVEAPTRSEVRDAAGELGGSDRMVAVVGPFSSAALEAAAPSLTKAGLPVLAPSAARSALEIADRSRFFRLIAGDEAEGDAAARYLTEVAGAQRVVSLSRASGYARAVSDSLSRTLGTRVVDADELDEDESFEEIVGAAQKAEPEAIFFAGPGADLAGLVGAAEAAGFDVLWAAASTAKDPGLLGLAEAQGALIFCSCADPDSSANSELRAWATEFQKDIGEAPGPFAVEAYEAIQIVATALAESGVTRDSSTEEIREAIAGWVHSHDYPGLTKLYAFDAQGELAEPTVFVYQVASSGWREVGTVGDLTD